MRVKPTVVQHEFISLDAEVVGSPNPSYIGVAGTVIDETRNTFVILHDNKRKTIVKSQATFRFTMPDATIVEIEGKILVGRPKERLKRRIRRLW